MSRSLQLIELMHLSLMTAFLKEQVAKRLSLEPRSLIIAIDDIRKASAYCRCICTSPDLSEDEIIRIYGKRWQIEVFFKTCKSMLNLVGECHSLSYDALTAHVAIVFTRYMLLALTGRQNQYLRTMGEILSFQGPRPTLYVGSFSEI